MGFRVGGGHLLGRGPRQPRPLALLRLFGDGFCWCSSLICRDAMLCDLLVMGLRYAIAMPCPHATCS